MKILEGEIRFPKQEYIMPPVWTLVMSWNLKRFLIGGSSTDEKFGDRSRFQWHCIHIGIFCIAMTKYEDITKE